MTDVRRKPLLLLLIFTILGFGLLFIMPNDMGDSYNKTYLIYGAGLCIMHALMYFVINKFNMGDAYLYLIVSLLATIGIIIICRLDYSGYGEYVVRNDGKVFGTNFGTRQIKWLLVGNVGFLVSYFAYRYIKNLDKLTWVYVWLILTVDMMVQIFGTETDGAKNWLWGFQPGEFVKILFVFAIASFIVMRPKKGSLLAKKTLSWQNKDLAITGLVYICLGFFLLQREWGTAVLFFLTYFTVMFLYGKNAKMILINSAFALVVLAIGYLVLDYIQLRFAIWFDPVVDMPGNESKQVMKSLISISEGGFFGTGLGNGFPQYTSASHTDFVFSSICEEMGVFTGVAVILMYFIFSYRGIKIAVSAKNKFNKAVALLFTTMFAYQIFIIIGGVTKLIPLTGITMPFVSYGGTSLLSSFMMVGILTAISGMDEKKEKGTTTKSY